MFFSPQKAFIPGLCRRRITAHDVNVKKIVALPAFSRRSFEVVYLSTTLFRTCLISITGGLRLSRSHHSSITKHSGLPPKREDFPERQAQIGFAREADGGKRSNQLLLSTRTRYLLHAARPVRDTDKGPGQSR